MNKYQEAINELKNNLLNDKEGDLYYEHCNGNDKYVLTKDEMIALQELVDRATPKKVDASKVITVYDYSTNQYETIVPCPNCANNIPFDNGFKFCPHCGQALDWGDEK